MFRKNKYLLFSILAVVAGLGFLAYPVITELITQYKASISISDIESVYDSMSDEARLENVEQAHAFNDRLRGLPTDVDIWPYDDQLTYHDEPSTMMAWIDIPKIGTKLPVYHHTTDAVLMAGVGHIDTTSLPVGGEGTLCALSGHSGMENTRMFDDIRLLEKGDEFVVWTLSEPYCYRVVDISVVEPYDTSMLQAQEGRDLCALVTCTPLNVNTHRLVVLGERCEYVPESDAQKLGVESVANRRTIPLLIVSGVVVVVLVFVIVCTRQKHKV